MPERITSSEPSTSSRIVILREPNVKPFNDEVFVPNILASSILDVDFSLLQKYGKNVLFIDADNTLYKVGSKAVEPRIVSYLKAQLEKGMIKRIFIATRSRKDKPHITSVLEAQVIKAKPRRRKPKPEYFQDALTLVGCKPEEVVMIGDRITHDIIGANRVGITTILINPIGGFIPIDWISNAPREIAARKRLKNYLKKQKIQTPQIIIL